eukprot:11820032-Alexandrium_andersonii.AAC.1
MSASLVGSEMCIRDRLSQHARTTRAGCERPPARSPRPRGPRRGRSPPVSYTHLTLPTICSV